MDKCLNKKINKKIVEEEIKLSDNDSNYRVNGSDENLNNSSFREQIEAIRNPEIAKALERKLVDEAITNLFLVRN